MLFRNSHVKWAFALLLGALAVELVGDSTAQAANPYRKRPQYDLFYNYYVDGGASNPAQLYLSPRPTPAQVGHTYITYQPLMPHEYLYRPHRRVYRRRDGHLRAANVTRVRWW